MTPPLFLLAFVSTLLPLSAAAMIDWRTHRVPDWLVAVAIVPTAIAAAVADGPASRVGDVAVGVGLMAMPLLLLHLVAPAAMGFGDVKLATALGAALGLLKPEQTVSALAVGAGLTLLVAWCRRPGAVPFAPGLVVGAAAAYALGSLEAWRVAV